MWHVLNTQGAAVIRQIVNKSTAIHSFINLQQARSVVIVRRRERRRENVRWVKTDLENPFKEKEDLYEFVTNTTTAGKTVKVILTSDVPGVGLEDDIVAVRKGMMRNKLIPEELAVYASLENLKERAVRLQKGAGRPKRLSLLAQETIQHMQSKPLRVVLHEDVQWEVLPKEPVLHALRKETGFQHPSPLVNGIWTPAINQATKSADGVFVPEHALILPDPPITEFGEYNITVIVNGVREVPVEMHLIKKMSDREDSEMDV